jgi:TfoX/Sxy family transcriptional regulator of competence genes
MPAPKSPIPSEKIAQYETLVATLPDVERKGAANPYTSVNGNMFSLLHAPEGRFALRLPEPARREFLQKFDTGLFEAYGVVMKEYVAVPDDLLADARTMRAYFAVSYEYAKTLRAKPTTRKKAAAKKSAVKRSTKKRR